MQAWTPVLVSDKDHPRAGTAGVCQGIPFTPEAASSGQAVELASLAKAAEQRAADALATLAEVTIAAQAAESDAKAARAAYESAAAEVAAGAPPDNAARVLVKFDSDLMIEAMKVEDLTILG